ncbi:MAG: Fur family transcriptional regulator [Ardenticatenaceae bacterium]
MAEKLRATLRAAGRPVTSQRLRVWEALNVKRDHPTAAELHQRCPELPLATVYNTLDLFTELGLIHSLALEGVVRYDVDTTEHMNVICTVCGNVSDVALQLPAALREWVRMESGFELSHPRVDWYGLCPTCQAKQEKGP